MLLFHILIRDCLKELRYLTAAFAFRRNSCKTRLIRKTVLLLECIIITPVKEDDIYLLNSVARTWHYL